MVSAFFRPKNAKKGFFELFGHSRQFFFYILRAGVRDCSVARLLDYYVLLLDIWSSESWRDRDWQYHREPRREVQSGDYAHTHQYTAMLAAYLGERGPNVYCRPSA